MTLDDVPPNELLALLPPSLQDAAQPVPLERGQVLFAQGARPGSLFYVVRGEVVLELKDRIGLSEERVRSIQMLFEQMKRQAMPVGERLIAAEAAIEARFARGDVEEASLRRLLQEAEAARTELRFIHLSQHHKTVPLLRPEQIQRYQVLRGYADDPCKSIPAGHNPAMYRRHMGCN